MASTSASSAPPLIIAVDIMGGEGLAGGEHQGEQGLEVHGGEGLTY